MKKNGSIAAIILAAGKGTRMKSRLPKVLHCLLGQPILGHVISLLDRLGISTDHQVVVVGHGREIVSKYLVDLNVNIVYQEQQLGTGHAVSCTRSFFSGFSGPILIICGDTPLFTKATLDRFVNAHLEARTAVSILSATFKDPTGYGRIIRGEDGHLMAIIEEKDAEPQVKKIREVNTGTYLVDSSVIFQLLEQVDSDNAQGEYYLTDVVGIALDQGFRVQAFDFAREEEAFGVNSRYQLAVAESIMLQRLRIAHMDAGVTISMPDTVYIEPTVVIESDVIICSHTVLKGRTRIGRGAVVGSHSYLDGYECPPEYILAPGTVRVSQDRNKGLCP